jgi:HK97 family phage major capsid protein
MDANTLAIARITGDMTGAWKTELDPITASDMTLDRVTFTARTLVSALMSSIELWEDAPNIGQVVADHLGSVLALELDRVALIGTGTPPEPKGIRNQTGVTVDSTTFTANGSVISGSAPSGAVAYDWLAKQVIALWTANHRPNAAIYHPRTAGELDALRAGSTLEPLTPPASVAALQRLWTTSVPINLTQGSNNDASMSIVGDFSQLMIGMRRELTLEVSREATIGTVSAFGNLGVAVRAYLRADVQLAHPAAFHVMLGIR